VKCKWVYYIKFSADGKPNRFKAHLVAKGFTQILGLDYDETFSPVTHLDSIRILLALAMLEDWEIYQIDIKTAFLNGDLDEEIYMQQLEGFIAAGQSGKVCRLHKALYGLKQASRQWHCKLHSALGKIGFQCTQGDYSIYLHSDSTMNLLTILIIYVDDIMLLGNSLNQIEEVKKLIATSFEISDLGEISYFLGLYVIHDQSQHIIDLDQSKYISDVLA
jgi:Reverse transcriptase (RNA-dependent DNA polymerase)